MPLHPTPALQLLEPASQPDKNKPLSPPTCQARVCLESDRDDTSQAAGAGEGDAEPVAENAGGWSWCPTWCRYLHCATKVRFDSILGAACLYLHVYMPHRPLTSTDVMGTDNV
jgi:hypothetical protein